MKINDLLYGENEITNPFFIDLINSPSIQRLKDISQLGVPDEFYHIKGFSRYEPSLGVFLFLNKLGASFEEQVAGLLHDVSHTPFSHVIDWAIGDPTKEDYQDKSHKHFLINSEIPPILKKHNLSLDFISNYDNFNLLEREAPKLCADRLDYSLREMASNNKKSLSERILKNLTVKNNQIVFTNLSMAKEFGKEYTRLQKEHWGGEEARTRYYLLSEVLKEAFNKKLISLKDMNKTEGEILRVLKNSNNKFILENLNLLKNGFQVIYDEGGIELKKKFRYIDPEVLINGVYVPLSELSEEYNNLINFEKKENNKINKIKIVPN